MSDFVDKCLVALADNAPVLALLAPVADVTRARLRALLAAVYDFPFGTLHEIPNVQVNSIVRERPLFAPVRERGNWTGTIPHHSNTEVVSESASLDNPFWIDLSVSLDVTLVLEVDPGEIQSILLRHVENIVSLADFQSRFRFLNLDEFLQKHHITTVEELREAYQYLITEIRLRAPGPFNPADPTNRHRYTLEVALVIRDTLDVAAALRDVKLIRLAAERSLAYRRETDAADVRTPIAPLLIFPAGTLAGKPYTESAVRAFFAAERIEIFFQP
jgi:hypothetical protein